MSKTDKQSGNFSYTETLTALDSLLAALAHSEIDPSHITHSRRRELIKRIDYLKSELDRFIRGISLVRLPETILDPSEPHVIGKLIADVLLEQPRHTLESVPRFYGSGVYALYYIGEFPAYSPVRNTETPLYVGKADPATPNAADPIQQGEKLSSRLNDHRRSIASVENLNVEDFECRYLVVKSAWQSTAETYLISGFSPIWNDELKICYGIGKHGDAASTRGNTRSPWDTLHPGPKWAWAPGNKENPLSAVQIEGMIGEHYAKHIPSTSPVLPAGAAPPPTDSVDDPIGL